MASEFKWTSPESEESHSYLLPVLRHELLNLRPRLILDLGCGNGALSGQIAEWGYEIVGLDSSRSGIDIAKKSFPQLTFIHHDINFSLPDDLCGKFDVVVSLEVIEHLFFPRALFQRAREALNENGGHFILSTPYHGYLKNLLLAVLNKFDDHWHPTVDFGHIKFFSQRTLASLYQEMGFELLRMHRVGRLIPYLAKSMVIVCRLHNDKRFIYS